MFQRKKRHRPEKGPRVIPPEQTRPSDPEAQESPAEGLEAEAERAEGITEAQATPADALADRILSPDEMTYLEQFQRLQAEFTNFRRRIQREKADWDTRAKGELLTGLLPILDAADRARAFWQNRPPDQDAEGLLLIMTRLEEFARSAGLEIQPTDAGTLFDPHEHEALLSSPSEDYPEGAILETLQPGYRFRGMLLRPARVRVSRGSAVDPS
jgi:molecular chaperone GrpE